jgi:hypothetical protein
VIATALQTTVATVTPQRIRGNEPDTVDAYTKLSDTSIGPRHFLRGNLMREKPEMTAFEWLQLGHGFFSVESR